ncbi:MAG: serine protease [Burkholderiales bacterium]|nr:serine protease [Burkholderiales bacterium]
MKKITYVLKSLGLVAIVASLSGCGTSAVIKPVVDKPVQSLDLKASMNSKPIQLTKVVVRLKRGQHVGAVQGGLLCVPQGDLNWKSGRLSLDSEEFTDAFKEELEKFAFKTVGDTSALFEDPSSWKSEILVASLVKDLKANLCFPLAGFGNFNSSKGEAFIKVDWQIYSKLDRAVVHTVTTEGAFQAKDSVAGGGDAFILNAFSQAARNLLADPKFREIVLRGGENVKETVFKNASGIVLATGKSQKLTSKIDEWSDGVVTVIAGRGHGSGFVVGENLVLTNHHVVGESSTVIVKLGAGYEVRGEVIAYNSARDVAAVKIAASLPRHFNMARELPAVGDEVYALGSPLNERLGGTVSKGIVSGIRTQTGKTFIQSDVNVRSGSSGGPLVTKDGNVVAMTVSALQVGGTGQGINFFIPIADVLDSMGIK